MRQTLEVPMQPGIFIQHGTLILLMIFFLVVSRATQGAGSRQFDPRARLLSNVGQVGDTGVMVPGDRLRTMTSGELPPTAQVEARSSGIYRGLRSLVVGSRAGERRVIQLARPAVALWRRAVPGATPHVALQRVTISARTH